MYQSSSYIHCITILVRENLSVAQKQIVQWANHSVRIAKFAQDHIQQKRHASLAVIALTNTVFYAVLFKIVNILDRILKGKAGNLSPQTRKFTHILFNSLAVGVSLLSLNTVLLKAVRIPLNPAFLAAGVSMVVILHLFSKKWDDPSQPLSREESELEDKSLLEKEVLNSSEGEQESDLFDSTNPSSNQMPFDTRLDSDNTSLKIEQFNEIIDENSRLHELEEKKDTFEDIFTSSNESLGDPEEKQESHLLDSKHPLSNEMQSNTTLNSHDALSEIEQSNEIISEEDPEFNGLEEEDTTGLDLREILTPSPSENNDEQSFGQLIILQQVITNKNSFTPVIQDQNSEEKETETTFFSTLKNRMNSLDFI